MFRAKLRLRDALLLASVATLLVLGLFSAQLWPHAAALAAIAASAAFIVARAQHERSAAELRTANLDLAGRLRELDALHRIGRDLSGSATADGVFQAVERGCREIFAVDACFIALAERGSPDLRCAHPSRTPLVGDGIARWVFDEKRPRRVDDLSALPADSPVRGALLDPAARSLAAVPLLVENRVAGVLCLQNRRPAAYSDHELSLLATIAQQAAVAIESARHHELATLDSLTGFLLRGPFFQRLAEEDRRARRYGGRYTVLMLDLDGFKGINDTHGHLAGDRYLAHIAATIRGELRSADLACRYGGDEFCLLLPETDRAGARIIAERIRTAVAGQHVGEEGRALRATVSIGLAAFPDDDRGEERSLLRHADEALYRAKRGGRNRIADRPQAPLIATA